MADRFVLTHVRRLPLFARLTPQQSEWVAEVTQILRYEPGEVVYQQGSPIPGLFMFISGSGAMSQRGADGVERPFGQVKTNEFLNETALFGDVTATMTLQISESAVVLFLSRQQMQAVLAYHPDIGANLTPTTPPQPTPPPKPVQQNVRANETVVLQVRKHWWAIVGRLAWIAAGVIVLWLLGFSLRTIAPQFPWLLVPVIGTLVLGGYAFYFYQEWHNDLFVITDRRVINIRQTIFTFRKEINEVSLGGVNEVGVGLPPLLDFVGRLLGYGTVIIRTSGDAENMVLQQIGNPKVVQQTVFDQRKRFLDGQQQQQQVAQRNAIKAEVNKFLNGGTNGAAPSSATAALNLSRPGLLSTEFINAKGETVYRKHTAIWTQHVFLPGALTLGAVIVLLTGVVGFIVPLLVVLVGIGLTYAADWDWRNDLYIVGDQTITIIHKRPFFLQDQKDLISLAQVDNVVAEVNGLFDTLLKMGQVKVLLTGTEAKNAKYFTQIYDPVHVQEEISRRQDRAEQAKRDAEAQRQRQAIVEYLSVYHESTQNTVQGAPAPQQPTTFSPPSPPDMPPRVRDGSRPPGIPRVQPDDRSSHPS